MENENVITTTKNENVEIKEKVNEEEDNLKNENVEIKEKEDSLEEEFSKRYKIIKKIGEGTQAVVYSAYDEKKKKPIAIKRIIPQGETNFKELMDEILIVQNFTNEYILTYQKSYVLIDTDDMTNEKIKNIYITMDFCDSCLQLEINKKIKEKKIFEFDTILEWTKEILMGLKYLHDKNIIHRYIKPESKFIFKLDILVVKMKKNNNEEDLESDWKMKICDFGSIKALEQKIHTTKSFKGIHNQ
jgi:serine/threonine-protein kinase CHEK2